MVPRIVSSKDEISCGRQNDEVIMNRSIVVPIVIQHLDRGNGPMNNTAISCSRLKSKTAAGICILRFHK